MLKKRLIGVITVKSGWAIQSFGYRRYLPLGRPEILAENLDRWGADEIIVHCIDRHGDQPGPDLELLRRLSDIDLSTPLIYGGGIRNEEDGIRVIQGGAERISLDALFHDDPQQIPRLSTKLGAQALVAAIPLTIAYDGAPRWYDYRKHQHQPIDQCISKLLCSGMVSEAIVIDHLHEGQENGFDNRLIDALQWGTTPLIAYGGISCTQQILELLARPQVAGVAVGNFLNYREHTIRHFKQQMSSALLRGIG